MAQTRIVLVRPENSANVGAVARAMANMGLDELTLVAPREWRTVEAWRMAWKAEHILEKARVADSLSDALSDRTYTAAVSGRPSPRVPAITVRDMAREVASLQDDAPAALVFGCESKGLSESELICCQRRVRIPSHEDQPSLNLAQAVMIAVYELYVGREGTSTSPPRERAADAEAAFALGALEEAMLSIGFLPVENPEARFVEWRELFGRAGLSPREVKILLALARRIRGTRSALERLQEESANREDTSRRTP